MEAKNTSVSLPLRPCKGVCDIWSWDWKIGFFFPSAQSLYYASQCNFIFLVITCDSISVACEDCLKRTASLHCVLL